MKRYELTADTQGFQKGQIFTGPTAIPDQSTTGFYPEGEDPNTKFCFYSSFVEGNPQLFTELKNPD